VPIIIDYCIRLASSLYIYLPALFVLPCDILQHRPFFRHSSPSFLSFHLKSLPSASPRRNKINLHHAITSYTRTTASHSYPTPISIFLDSQPRFYRPVSFLCRVTNHSIRCTSESGPCYYSYYIHPIGSFVSHCCALFLFIVLCNILPPFLSFLLPQNHAHNSHTATLHFGAHRPSSLPFTTVCSLISTNSQS